MAWAIAAVAVLAILGWAMAGVFYARLLRSPGERPGKLVMLDYAGRPESVRTIRTSVPETVTRPRGRGPAMPYRRLCAAVIFQATEPS